MDGQVVHAVKGERANYRPIRSSLCAGSRPQDIVAALLQLHPFTTIYVADLDAILHRGDNTATLIQIKNRHPQISLWVDAGLGDIAALDRWLSNDLGRPVIGSETLTDLDTLDHPLSGSQPVLSLDYRGDTFIGPQQLAGDTTRWPSQVIAMTLARVGGATGPDLPRLRQLRKLAPRHEIFAAGGVRHNADLADLMHIGVAGVLLASALHDRALAADELSRYG